MRRRSSSSRSCNNFCTSYDSNSNITTTTAAAARAEEVAAEASAATAAADPADAPTGRATAASTAAALGNDFTLTANAATLSVTTVSTDSPQQLPLPQQYGHSQAIDGVGQWGRTTWGGGIRQHDTPHVQMLHVPPPVTFNGNQQGDGHSLRPVPQIGQTTPPIQRVRTSGITTRPALYSLSSWRNGKQPEGAQRSSHQPRSKHFPPQGPDVFVELLAHP